MKPLNFKISKVDIIDYYKNEIKFQNSTTVASFTILHIYR